MTVCTEKHTAFACKICGEVKIDEDIYKLEVLENSLHSWQNQKAKLISGMLEGKKILDVGCGTGILLRLLSKPDLELYGTDFSDFYLERAIKNNPNIKFFKGNLCHANSWDGYKGKFDTIICSEVIEHLIDDRKGIEILYSLLKPNGVLIITVPAFSFLNSLLDERLGHYRRYTKKSMYKILESTGFKVEYIRYWNVLGFFGWLVLIKLLRKDLQKSVNSFMDKILTYALIIESKIKIPFGLTVVVKVRKPKIENPSE